jgi:hypothetical protein
MLIRPGFWQSLTAWSPDSRYLLIGAIRPVILDSTTRAQWPLIDDQLQRVPEGVDWSEDGNPWFGPDGNWAPDGSYLAFSLTGHRESFTLWNGITHDAIMKLMARPR